jgi:hypothetical protein
MPNRPAKKAKTVQSPTDLIKSAVSFVCSRSCRPLLSFQQRDVRHPSPALPNRCTQPTDSRPNVQNTSCVACIAMHVSASGTKKCLTALGSRFYCVCVVEDEDHTFACTLFWGVRLPNRARQPNVDGARQRVRFNTTCNPLAQIDWILPI